MSGPRSGRPRPRTLIAVDPDNAYAKLGVSPLSSTEEIKRVVDERRAAAGARRAARADTGYGEDDAEMMRLQQLDKEIGTPRARAAYDAAHPANALLTVQPGTREGWLERGGRGGLISEWLVEELGLDAWLPSPSSLPLWVPGGLGPGLLEELRAYQAGAPPEVPAAPAATPAPSEGGLSLEELGGLHNHEAPGRVPDQEMEHG